MGEGRGEVEEEEELQYSGRRRLTALAAKGVGARRREMFFWQQFPRVFCASWICGKTGRGGEIHVEVWGALRNYTEDF